MKITTWARDLLIIPIIVGVVVGVVIGLFQLVTQSISKEKRNLDIQLEGPISLNEINKLLEGFQFKTKYYFEWDGQPKVVHESKQNLESQTKQKVPDNDNINLRRPIAPRITGIKMSLELDELYVYKLHINNSGDIALQNLSAHIAFRTDNEDFIVATYSHFTEPKSMSDTIEHLDSSDSKNVKFRYASINPGEQDVITVLASRPSSFGIDLRGSGYTVSKESVFSLDDKENVWIIYMLFAVLGAVFSILLRYFINCYLTRA